MRLISDQVNQQREAILAKVKEEFGIPITFTTMKASWAGLSLKISLSDVTIFDPEVPVGFMHIDNIKLYPVLTTILFEKEPRFKKLVLQGSRLMLGKNDKEGWSILGLEGEVLPATIDYNTIMALLAKQQSLEIENSEIIWRSSHFQIRQWLEGEFHWIKSKDIDWVFTGEQSLQIGENLILPHSDVTLSIGSNLKFANLSLNGDGFESHCHILPQGNIGPDLNCNTDLKNLDIKRIRSSYSPAKSDPPLLKWLFSALRHGKITEATVNVRGNLNALKTTGQIDFKDVYFLYTEGWPAIEAASGIIKLQPDTIPIQLTKGSILGVDIDMASAILTSLNKEVTSVVEIEGSMHATLKKGLEFLQQSPLKASVATFIEPLDPRGLMTLNLQLSIPLAVNDRVKVAGKIIAKDGEIQVPDSEFRLKQLHGIFSFTEQGIESSNTSAYLENEPLDLSVKTINIAKQEIVEVTARGTFNAELLKEKIQFPLVDKLQGQAFFNVAYQETLGLHQQSTRREWLITSDLQGISIELPVSLGKLAMESRPISIKVIDVKDRRKISVHLNDALDAKLEWVNSRGEYRLKQGNVVLGRGSSDWISTGNVLIDGKILSLNVNEWMNSFVLFESKRQFPAPPLEIKLFIEHLDLYGLSFGKVWLSTNFSKSPITWKFNGETVKGIFVRDPQHLNIDLESLNMTQINITTQAKSEFLKEQKRLPVTFRCGKFQYGNAIFGNVSFELVPKIYGYAIQDLLFKTAKSELYGQGEWHFLQGKPYTLLEGEITASDMGELFTEWGYPSAIKEANGYIDFQFEWPNHPYQFNLDFSRGNAKLKFEKGRIMGVKPGLGRIIGLLNLESIKRRLQLDFSDLLKQGFVFDTLTGRFEFQGGVAKTNKLLIAGPSASIELIGSADLRNKTLDLMMKVVPNLGVGLPIAAALAGGPAVGAGVWLFDKIAGAKINKITQHLYQINGTWEAPNIEDLGIKSQRASE